MAISDLSTLGASDNQITFNDYASSPLFRVQQRYPTKREIEQLHFALPESMGIADFQTLIGSTVFILDGKMYPNNEQEFNSGRQALRKLANPYLAQNDSLTDGGYVPYKFTANVPQQLFVKVLYVDMQENTTFGQIQPFRLYCTVKYPVIFAQQVVTGNLTLGTSPAATGGAVIPATIPMSIGTGASSTTFLPFTLPVILGATPSAGSLTLNNIGDFPAYPTITIYGPISNPTLINLVTGEYISLNLTLQSGASAVLAYDQDSTSVTANNQNAQAFLTSGSTLFKIPTGTTAFTLSGSSIGQGASATISFFPAWPLS